MATKRKMRKFADGGFATAEGENKNISDDIRARAMRSVMPDDSPAGTSTYGEQNDMPETKSITKTTVSKTAPKSSWDDDSKIPAMPDSPRKVETPAENKARMEGLLKKQGLERVEPENYVPGPGLLRNILKNTGKAALNTIERKALPSPKSSVPQLNAPTPRLSAPKGSAETPRLPAPKAEVLTAAEKKEVSGMKSRINKNDDAETVVRARAAIARSKDNDKASKSVRARANKALEGMKKGGVVRSSASRRADGCAIRGKTRA